MFGHGAFASGGPIIHDLSACTVSVATMATIVVSGRPRAVTAIAA